MLFITHRQEETLDKLKRGEITDVCASEKWPADAIALFALREGFLQKGFKAFPDPRKNYDVPIEVILLAHVMRSLNDEHSLLLAPYMLNNAELVTELGYNVKILEEGFNDKNTYPRQAAFHGETFKHILLKVQPSTLLQWFNKTWLPLWREQAPGRTLQYILDGTKIEIPAHLKDKFQGCGMVRDDEGHITYGYKAVFLYEIIDRKGVIVAVNIGPIQTHDIVLGRELVKEFPFEKGALLIMDRGFIDGAWITELKTKRQVDVCLPLRRNMEITQAAIATADRRGDWKGHPTRKGQTIFEFKKPDLYWGECEYLQSGVLVRWHQHDGTPDEVLFVTTQRGLSGKKVLEIYDQRAEIEESNRQLKCFQGIKKLLSKKYTNIVFRIIVSVLGYNLLNLFLNSENCKTLEDYSLKTLRQKRRPDKYAKLIVYAENTFAVLNILEFLPLILRIKPDIQKKLASLFESLHLGLAPP